MSLLVPGLRCPVDCDFAAQLAKWLDHAEKAKISPRPAADCQQTVLTRLHNLRTQVATALKGGYETALESLSTLQEYAAALQECQENGFPELQNQGTGLLLSWKSASQVETHSTFTWERANVIWNLAALEAFQATQQPLTTKPGWKNAGSHLQKAASLIHYICNGVLKEQLPSQELSTQCLAACETYLLADAQRAAYQFVQTAARPPHVMCAKLAAAAIPLYQEVEEHCQSDITQDWAEIVRAWGMWMSAVCEYHQSVVHQSKLEMGWELARLEAAVRYGNLCHEYCLTFANLQDLSQLVASQLAIMQGRLQEAQQENDNNNSSHQAAEIPDFDELPDIPPQKTVKLENDITKLLPPIGQSIFTSSDIAVDQNTTSVHAQAGNNNNNSNSTTRHMNLADLEQLVARTEALAEEKTESGRRALATVNLPHSLTAYRQERSGGGIPRDLWQRVEALQRNETVRRLRQESWELRDVAETASVTYKKIHDVLEEDLQMDSLFREENPSFGGHDVREVQNAFRQTLQKYAKLMASAQEGDLLVLRRLEMLDTDPKFKLLQFRKSQLDRLLPGRGRGPDIDVESLSRHLVELSALFQKRDDLCQSLHDCWRSISLSGRGEEGNATSSARGRLNDLIRQVEINIERQSELLHSILNENEAFMHAREKSQAAASSDRSILMIEDAIEEIDQLSKHLKEGRAFYDVVIPKLDKLRQQVGDVSARLTIERCEHEDRACRSRQEAADARMAASLADNNNGGTNPRTSRKEIPGSRVGVGIPEPYSNDGRIGGPPPVDDMRYDSDSVRRTPQPVPGVEEISHDEPVVRVDDEKVASLVAMDFDPDKVVAALKKYDNNVEQALNDLLSC